MLIDFGAEYANYHSDITRVLPISGRFSSRQKEIYNAVLRMQRAAMQLLKPGMTFKEIRKEMGYIAEKELVDLELISLHDLKSQRSDAPLYQRYFMHGVSHHLGLNVHDYGDMMRPLEAGMVLTCEPGIYVREEGIGIRLENDLLITQDGTLDLAAQIPIEAEAIEELMNTR